MKLEDLGYDARIEKLASGSDLRGFALGRVLAEHKEQYVVGTEQGEARAEITGNLRFSARSREDFPAVGDWVALTVPDADFALIHRILPRFSVISRQAVGQSGEAQVIAANIDYAFLVQALDRDRNLNRLERYLTICHAAKVSPIIVPTKTDLLGKEELAGIIAGITRRIQGVPVVAVSNQTRDGYEALGKLIEKGKTYCLLGSSGVGKSTLLNNLAGRAIMRTGTISPGANRGRHVTSHRELIVLDHGGILIDNPGMREVGVADLAQGLETTFDQIVSLAQGCRFKDCTHTGEAGCAVLAALENGELDQGVHASYLRMERERAHFEASVAERRKRDKSFGKMQKSCKKDLSRNQY